MFGFRLLFFTAFGCTEAPPLAPPPAPEAPAAEEVSGPIELPGEGYNLLSAPSKVGATFRTVEHIEMDLTAKLKVPGRGTQSFKTLDTLHNDFKQRVTAVDGAKEIDAYRVLVKESVETSKVKFPGQAWETERKELPLHGFSFRAEHGDHGWTYALDDGQASGRQAASFEDFGILLTSTRLPPRKLQPTDTWELEPEEAARLCSSSGERATGSISYAFDKVDVYQEVEVAVLSFSGACSGLEADGMTLSFELTGTEYRSTEGLGTLRFEAAGPMRMSGDFDPERGITGEFTGQLRYEVTVTR